MVDSIARNLSDFTMFVEMTEEYNKLRIGRGSMDRRHGSKVKQFKCAVKDCRNVLEVFYMNEYEYFQCVKAARQNGWTIGPPHDLCRTHKGKFS